jgi:hypothetical protein
MVMPFFGQFDHDVQHFLDHLRVEGRGRLVEQHDLGLHAQRAGDGDALLLAAGELAGVLLRLLGDLHPVQDSASPMASAWARGILRTRIVGQAQFSRTSGAERG